MEHLEIAETRQEKITGLIDYVIEERFKDGKYNATFLLNQYNEANGTNKAMSAFMRNLSAKECLEDTDTVKIKSSHGRSSNQVWMETYTFVKFVSWLIGDKGKDIISNVIIRKSMKWTAEFTHKRLMEYIEEIFPWKSDDPNNNISLARIDQGILCCIFKEYTIGIESFATNIELLDKYTLELVVDSHIRYGTIVSRKGVIDFLLRIYTDRYKKDK